MSSDNGERAQGWAGVFAARLQRGTGKPQRPESPVGMAVGLADGVEALQSELPGLRRAGREKEEKVYTNDPNY